MAKRSERRNRRNSNTTKQPQNPSVNPQTIQIISNLQPNQNDNPPIDQKITQKEETEQVDKRFPTKESEFSSIWKRTRFYTVFLGILAFSAVIFLYVFIDVNLFLVVLFGLIFAGMLSFINSFFNQSRYHYKFLILNESASRFISVLGSILIGRIIAFEGQLQINNILWISFIAIVAAFVISVFLTNEIKSVLSSSKHICEAKMSDVFDGVPVEAGFKQKECGNTDNEQWLAIKEDFDKFTNWNISLFFLFLIFVSFILIFITIKPFIQKIPELPEVTLPIIK